MRQKSDDGRVACATLHCREELSMTRLLLLIAAAIVLLSGVVEAQRAPTGPPEDPEQVIGEANKEPQAPFSIADRPIYKWVQQTKKELNDKFGINFAIEDTAIYQAASGGVHPNDAMVNTLSLFATWKIYRSEDGKDFAGPGFQFETRGDPLNGHMTDFRDSLGTLWSPNDATSNDYSKINQLWWGQKFAGGRLGFQIGKID